MLETAKQRPARIIQSPQEFITETTCTPDPKPFRHYRLYSAGNQFTRGSEQHLNNHLQTKLRMHTLGRKSFNRSF